VQKISNDVTMLEYCLYYDIFSGLRGAIIALGGVGYLSIYARELMLPALILVSSLSAMYKVLGNY